MLVTFATDNYNDNDDDDVVVVVTASVERQTFLEFALYF